MLIVITVHEIMEPLSVFTKLNTEARTQVFFKLWCSSTSLTASALPRFGFSFAGKTASGFTLSFPV